jgi:type I restriction enzyme M protein
VVYVHQDLSLERFPLTALLPKRTDIDVQWENGEPPIYFASRAASAREPEPAPIVTALRNPLPPGTARLHYADLQLVTDVVPLFARLDDLLHQVGHIREDRHGILLKLLLVKLYDEERARTNPSVHMIIQDFTAVEPAWDVALEKIFAEALEQALVRYNGVLAGGRPIAIGCSAQVLRETSAYLCKIRLFGALPQVIQDLFMYFGRFHYRVDLGQYFTPSEVIRLIVEIINPRPDERIVDPACGTADFLVGARQVIADRHGADISPHLHGYDIAPLAVHLSIFNLLLNGGGSLTHIQMMDTLLNPLDHEQRYHVALCNPPFGARIVEKRPHALTRFALVNAKKSGARRQPKAQEVGLLYVEMCLRAVMPGGRVGILVPNGYLGNRSERYLELRRWLLLNARIAAIIGFPRFTFKKSGADVSASALILERREQPLADLSEIQDYPIHVNFVEKVGWDLQSRYATRIFKRDPRDGTELRNERGERIPDTDFEEARRDALTCAAVDCFPWMDQSVRKARTTEGWSVKVSQIVNHPDLALDPKRWSRKHIETCAAIAAVPHVKLGSVIRPVSRLLRKKARARYRYVEIEKMYEAFGAYIADECSGWELPNRGRLIAAPGDIFIANIWSSAGKWMLAGDEASDGRLIVTTGCSHFELIPGQEALLPDLVFGLCSEAFKVQLRARATGSDGLSTISIADMASIVLPRMQSPEVREQIQRRISEVRTGQLILPRMVRDELARVAPETNVPLRSSHVVQV